MNAAYSYVRFSTKEQMKGDSMRRQTESFERWCRESKVDVADNYRDLGVSAYRGKNAATGALSAFLKLARDGKIPKDSYLVVESLDRLSRLEIMDAYDIFRDIIKSGIRLVTLSDGQVYTREKINENPLQLIIGITVMSRANEESKTKSHRLGQAWINKRRNATTAKLTAICPAWLRMSADRKSFELIPDRAAIVVRIFESVRNGKGANSITKELNRAGVKPFGKAKHWSPGYIKKILENRSAIGEYHPHTVKNGKRSPAGEPVADYYPAAVSKELFATVQQIREQRPSHTGKSGFNVFSKLTFDRETGCSMAYVNKGRAEGFHYLVPSTALIGKSAYASWQYDDFLQSFLFNLEQAVLEKPKAKPENGELAIAKMELAECAKQVDRLIDFLTRGDSTSVESKLRECEARKAELQSKIKSLESQTTAQTLDPSEIDWKDSSALRDNLRAVVKRIEVDAKRKHIWTELFDGRKFEYESPEVNKRRDEIELAQKLRTEGKTLAQIGAVIGCSISQAQRLANGGWLASEASRPHRIAA